MKFLSVKNLFYSLALGGAITAFPVATLALQSVSGNNPCCLYYKPSGASGQCQVYDKSLDDVNAQDVNGDGTNMAETFACSQYNQSTDKVGKSPFTVLGQGLYIRDTNIAGALEYVPVGDLEFMKTECVQIGNFVSERLSAPLSNYDKKRCEYAVNMDPDGDGYAFTTAYEDAKSGLGGQVEKQQLKGQIEQKQASEAETICCIPKDPSSAQCAVPAPKTDELNDPTTTKSRLETILDSLNDVDRKALYFSCPDTHLMYSTPCGGTAKISKPTDKYTNTPDEATIGTYCSKTQYDPPKKDEGGKTEDKESDDFAKLTSLAKGELNRIGTTDVSQFLGRAIGVLMGIMGSIALAMFVYAGFLFMVSGTTDSVEKARSILVWSSMGMVVVFASYALVQLIFATF